MCTCLIIHYSTILACICNSQGSTKTDDSMCDNKCCNEDGSCKCIVGYSGNDCNACDIGYYVSATFFDENTCSGKYVVIENSKSIPKIIMFLPFMILF